MRRWSGLVLQAIVLCVGAGCGGCEDERTFTGQYFEPYEYGIYDVVLEPSLEAPDRVDFGALGAREFASREVVIANVGRAPLLLKSMEITPLFRLRFPSFMADGAPESIAPGERITAQISFVSNAGEAVRGVLRLETNDPKRPVHEIVLSVNMSQPCLEITPSQRVDFGVGWSERSVTLHNCSRTAPTKLDLAIEGGGRLFDFSNFSEAWLEPLEPDESREVGLLFRDFGPGTYTAELVARSDDPERPEQRVELIARGKEFECPDARIGGWIAARMVSAQAAPRAELRGRPLDRVQLDATMSSSPDSSIERVEWTLVSRPPDSSAVLEGEGFARELFLDLAGHYEVELMVFDARGVPACEPSRLSIEATPNEDVHVQLVWDTPSDMNQLDELGTDLDLHLLHPNGRWNDGVWDCFWQNQTPSWGEPGSEDDPSLDIDDVDGSGPENINMSNPERDKTYRVGVHYFADQAFGRSFATLRVYIRGQLVQELRRKALDNEQFWRPLDIVWPSGQIVVRDEVFQTIP